MYNQNGGCQDGARCRGSLTSPPIQLPASGNAYLHFKYNYTDPETNPYADLRRVQISTRNSDGTTYGPFKDLLALGGKVQDSQGIWLDSPDGIKIACSGQVVRLRFLLDTLDGVMNSGLTWSVDQVSLAADPPATADAGETNTLSPDTAPVNGAISPVADTDLYSFSATQGSAYQVDVVAQNFNPSLELLDADQSSVLASGHAVANGMRVGFRAPASSTYTLRVRSNPYPQGASNDTYTIALKTLTDTTAPAVTLTVPLVDGVLKGTLGLLTVNATDDSGEISHVDYYAHIQDGTAWRWWKIGSSWDAGNGWAMPLDPKILPGSGTISLWARAYDWAGNAGDTVAFQVPVEAKNKNYLPNVAK
jgi:hypothetical protein